MLILLPWKHGEDWTVQATLPRVGDFLNTEACLFQCQGTKFKRIALAGRGKNGVWSIAGVQ